MNKVNDDYTIVEPAVYTLGVEASADGYYSYEFNNVKPGYYLVIAGSDRNSDGYLGDGGEALGAYPTVEQMVVIEVSDNDISNLDFTTNLMLSISNNVLAVGKTAVINKPAAIPPGFKRLQ